MQSLGAASVAFRERFFSAEPLGTDPARPDAFESWDARRARYAIFWAYYENTVYSRIHAYSAQLKLQQGLYKYTRGCYNPAFRLGETWPVYLMGGSLDPAAGDGKATPSALPIETRLSRLRAPVAKVLADSNWAVNKSVWTRHGAVLGDCCLRVCADDAKGQVRLEVVHPGSVRWVRKDVRGAVKEIVLQETRFDPRQDSAAAAQSPRTVTYTEEVLRDGGTVVIKTYLDGVLYPWNGRPAVAELPLGFTPFVLVQHLNVGLDFGLAEMHAARVQFGEVDDLGSKLHDQVRKLVEGAWLFSGVTNPAATPKAQGPAPTRGNPEPDREGLRIFYGPENSRAHSLVAPVDVAAVSAEIRAQLDAIEDDYPELRFERLRTGGHISGEALRVARQPVETKVNERRAGYDDGLVRAVQMAIALGGHLGYPGFEGYGLESYAAGDLDFRVGARPVFTPDELDRIAERQARYAALQTAIAAGLPRAIAFAEAGYTPDQVRAIDAAAASEEEQQLNRIAAQQQALAAGVLVEQDAIPPEGP